MPEKILTTDPPEIDENDFDEFLATDDLFVDYFNSFLELPSFPEPLRFNTDTGGFEVLTPEKFKLADKIKSYARSQTPISQVYKNAIPHPPIRLPHYEREKAEENSEEEEEIKTSFSVKCLDKEQGMQWIKRFRLPTFLRSDLYMEYRLVKLLSQIETRRCGIKLTVDQSYRPWHKEKKVTPPTTPVNEKGQMMERLSVTMGYSTPSQTQQWFTMAKQVETVSVSGTPRPVTSAPVPTPRRKSSSRPISSLDSRSDIADDAEEYFKKENNEVQISNTETKFSSRLTSSAANSGSSVVFSPSVASNYPIHADAAACVLPLPLKRVPQVGHVVKIEPELSDDESDQGVGSESDESKEETNSEKSEAQEQKRSYNFDVTGVTSYSSVFVSLAIKEAFLSMSPNLSSTKLDNIVNLDPIIQSSSHDGAIPLSHLTHNMLAEAVMEADEKAEFPEDKFSNRSQSARSLSGLLEQPAKKSISFLEKYKLISTFDEETDSVFSDETDESEFTTSSRRFDFTDSKGFNKFKTFLQNTIGEKLLLLWLDIDKSRFAVHQAKTTTYLQKLRKTYLKIGSTKRLPKECLSRYKLEHATLWRIDHLHEVQRSIAESLLLYWAPRYLVRQTPKTPPNIFGVDNPEEQGQKSHDPRPLSSQSYPSPKTMTIAPLRPKSCFPRLKNGHHGEKSRVSSEYHQYFHRDVIMTQHDPSPPLTTPSPIPSYLAPKVAALTERGRKGFQLPVKRPASAGPLTRQTRARFERKKSAVTKSNNVEKIRVKSSVMIRSPPSSMTSQVSVKGSPAMESMLQALYHDTRAGWFFTQFCEQSGNKMWNNAVHFWFDLQDFHHLFYGEIFDHFTVERKAQVIFSTYIVSGAREDLCVSVATRRQVQLKLSPAFDELFDSAEEQVLKMLIVPWNQMLGTDQASYSKIELINQERSLNVAPRYLTYLQKKGIKQKKQPVKTEQESMEKYEEDLWMKVPEDVKNYTFDELIRNRIELEFFRKFLEENYAKTDLLCWLDIESFKRIPHPANEKRDEKAKEIRTKYLHKKYFFGPNSPATKDEQNKAVLAGGGWGKTLKERPPNELITEAQKYVRQRIEKRWLPLFLATEEFQDRQRPKSQMSDVADDVILQKKKKRGEPWRLLDNRWQSSSRDLMEFRRGLTNKITTSQFRKYVSLKGEFLENNVLFWVEVQKYKDFCHIHNDPVSTEIKVTSIINCFISSHIPPSLQIDISAEMAEKIIEKRKEMGPYVFREAQLTVFRVLFTHWSGFCEFRKNLSDEKITSTLERQRRKRMERIKKQIKEQEEEALLREEAKAAKEADTLDLPDILSTRGSEIAESLMSESRHNNLAWSYGKHVEGLERQRQLLIMENEVKGQIPPEALPARDVDVSSEPTELDTESDEGNDGSVDTSASKGKKKRKDKVLMSTLKEPNTAGDKTQEISQGKEQENVSKKQKITRKKGNEETVKPLVLID